MRIALRWGKDPLWYYSLPEDLQISLLAEYRLSNEDSKDRQDRQERIKRARMEEMLSKGKP
jgi:hypothetical protein